MEAVKPTKNVSGLVQALSKVLRVRASGIVPDDEIPKINFPENNVDTSLPQKVCLSQEDDEEKKKKKKKKLIRNREAMEVLLAKIFASISAIKAAYAQLQLAQSPYDPDSIHSADEIVVSELKNISELKHYYFKNQHQIPPPQDSQLSAEIQEQQNLIKTYEIMLKKFQSQLQLKDSEILFMKEKLLDSDKQNKTLEKRLNPNNLHISGLNPTHFITAHHQTIKSIRTFVQLMIDEMETAKWDIDAAANSIEPNMEFAKPNHKRFAFESYVCKKMFADFQEPNFSISSESSTSKQRQLKRHYFKRFLDLKERKAMEFLTEKPKSGFGKFCRLKYLSLVHPKMEMSFFGDLAQRNLVNSGGFPVTQFFNEFSEMARRVWVLHCLGMAMEEEASIFQVRKDCRFSEVYMESAAEDDCHVADVGSRVGFTIVPGIKVGKTIVQCKVYVTQVR